LGVLRGVLRRFGSSEETSRGGRGDAAGKGDVSDRSIGGDAGGGVGKEPSSGPIRRSVGRGRTRQRWSSRRTHLVQQPIATNRSATIARRSVSPPPTSCRSRGTRRPA